jgi:twitching motility protein PilU
MDVRSLLKVMVDHEASDLYLTVDSAPAYRIHGSTQQTDAPPFTNEQLEALALALMRAQQRGEFEEKMEMNLALYYKELGRFRVNIFRQRGNVGLVFRHIKAEIQTVDQLNLPQIVKDISMTKRGLVLVVGATGSGKSTTLAAMIDHRNTIHPGHIVTVEDPIEFVHNHKRSLITQREVGFDTLSFQNALKNTLRQAPDVILIGEVRDTETMEAAITFAETGHLCIGTLHSNNANQAIERIMNFFPVERHAQIYLSCRSIFAPSSLSDSCHPWMESVSGTKSCSTRPALGSHQEGFESIRSKKRWSKGGGRLSDVRPRVIPTVQGRDGFH